MRCHVVVHHSDLPHVGARALVVVHPGSHELDCIREPLALVLPLGACKAQGKQGEGKGEADLASQMEWSVSWGARLLPFAIHQGPDGTLLNPAPSLWLSRSRIGKVQFCVLGWGMWGSGVLGWGIWGFAF